MKKNKIGFRLLKMKEMVKAGNNSNSIEKVHGNNKARDFIILQMLAEGTTQNKIMDILATMEKPIIVSQGRFSQIKLNNLELLNELTLKSPLATSAGRLRLAMTALKGKTSSSKDMIDILDYMRKEQQGERVGPTLITIINNIPTPWDNEQKQ